MRGLLLVDPRSPGSRHGVAGRGVSHLGLSDTPEKLLSAGHAAWEERLVCGLGAAGYGAFDREGRPVFGISAVLEVGRLVLKNAVRPATNWNFLDPRLPLSWITGFKTFKVGFAQAKQLQREMCKLVERYRSPQARGRQCYIVRIAMAPLSDD